MYVKFRWRGGGGEINTKIALLNRFFLISHLCKNRYQQGTFWKCDIFMLNFDGGVEAVKLILKLKMSSISFQSDTSVVVLVVLCFGVEFLCCLSLMCVFIFLVQFG